MNTKPESVEALITSARAMLAQIDYTNATLCSIQQGCLLAWVDGYSKGKDWDNNSDLIIFLAQEMNRI